MPAAFRNRISAKLIMDYQDKLASLTPFCKDVALSKATEPPFSGCFNQPQTEGSYLCRRCGLGLWQAQDQFSSHCGWPSFDDRTPAAIFEQIDADGIRTEILCNRCHAHLGHVFHGEGYTHKNQRDCVNSVMLDFTPIEHVADSREIIVAGGCFWGIEYWFMQAPGVLITECGYTGGHSAYPSYTDVCLGKTAHYEAVRVVYDPKISNEDILYRIFFEIHDPYQGNGQGPDIGPQYQSAIFYANHQQKNIAEKQLAYLSKGKQITCTSLLEACTFWPAESAHQQYYYKNGHLPYCHIPTKRF